eukprot:tig00021348_g20588.t1
MLRAYNPPEPAPPNPKEFQVPEEELKRAVERSQRYTPVRATTVKLEKFKTEDGRGTGVRTLERIKAGQFVCEYAGKNITEKEGKQRELKYVAENAQDWYFYYYQLGSRRMCVDAMRDERGIFGPPGFGRIINHSRTKPNLCTRALMVPGTGDKPDMPRLFLFAIRDIDEGEELLFDYGDRDGKSVQNNPWLLH